MKCPQHVPLGCPELCLASPAPPLVDAPAATGAVFMTVCLLQPLAPASLTPRTLTSKAASASRFFFTHWVPLMMDLAEIQPYSAPDPGTQRRHCVDGYNGMVWDVHIMD